MSLTPQILGCRDFLSLMTFLNVIKICNKISNSANFFYSVDLSFLQTQYLRFFVCGIQFGLVILKKLYSQKKLGQLCPKTTQIVWKINNIFDRLSFFKRMSVFVTFEQIRTCNPQNQFNILNFKYHLFVWWFILY